MSYTVVNAVYATYGGVPDSTPAWRVINPDVLWKPAAQRGADKVIPAAAGVIPNRRRRTVTPRTVEMFFHGAKKWDGSTYSDEKEGLYLNLRHWIDNVIDPTGTGDGTRAVIAHPPSTLATPPTLTGYVHIIGFDWQLSGARLAKATMDISIPLGELA